MKIYTKGGDKGKTGLIGGNRVSKDDIRLETYGTVDELNSWIGMLRSYPHNNDFYISELVKIQSILFTMCSHLACDKENATTKMPEIPLISANHIQFLEESIDKMNKNLPALQNFILPGGAQLSASCHIARTVCRRAERSIISMSKKFKVDQNIIIFVNRLSDYLFVLARYFSYKQNVDEINWDNTL